jgi:hypothetical protein
MLLFTCQSVEQCLFSLFLLFLGPSLGWLPVLRFFARCDGRNYIADYRFVLPKGSAARRTNGQVLLQPFLLVVG